MLDTFVAAHAGLASVVVADRPGCHAREPGVWGLAAGRYLPLPQRGGTRLDPCPPAGRPNSAGLGRGWTVLRRHLLLQLAVNAPPVYPTFLDFAGQDEPTLGDRAAP